MNRIICGAILLLTLSGCSLYSVSDEENSGIEYYPVVQREYVTAIYQEPWVQFSYTVTYRQCSKLDKSGKCADEEPKENSVTAVRFTTPSCAEKLLNDYLQHDNAVNANTEVSDRLLEGKEVAGCKYRAKSPEFLTDSQFAQNAGSADRPSLTLVETKRETKTEVSKRPRYINVKRSAIGTSSATITLNGNGTLTSAQASVESKTLETILGALPIEEFVSHDLGIDEATAEETVREITVAKTSLVKKAVAYVYTLTVPKKKLGAGNALPTVATAKKYGTLKYSVVSPASGTKKKDDDAISVSGTIKLPKPKTDGAK